MKSAGAVTWVALVLIAAAWTCRLAWIALPALDGTVNHAAEALYLAELAQQRDAVAIAAPPTIESIAREVHRRAAHLLLWIGLGLGLCLVAALSARAQRLAILASAMVFFAGWIGLDAYAQVGLLRGLDLKLRLVQNDPARLIQFVVIDALLPFLVTSAAAATLMAVLNPHHAAD
jgi:hypothetical protein